MSSTAFLSGEGLFPYSEYKSGATKLNQLNYPRNDSNVSSLITYYQMLQVKDDIQQQYRTVPRRSNKENISDIIRLLDSHKTVLIGFCKSDWGGHAILAYDYEYGSYSYSGVNYQGRIKICDPNQSMYNDSSFYIYFNTNSYNWMIPAYSLSEINSLSGARFNYIGADVSEINNGGYLSGSRKNYNENYVARIDAAAISDNRSVNKVANSNGSYYIVNNAPGDIVEDYSYILGNESEGMVGYNLLDGESSYKVSQSDAVKLSLSIDYEDSLLSGKSQAGKAVTFGREGYVKVEGDNSDYSISMTFDDDHPTNWFTIQVSGSGEWASLSSSWKRLHACRATSESCRRTRASAALLTAHRSSMSNTAVHIIALVFQDFCRLWHGKNTS